MSTLKELFKEQKIALKNFDNKKLSEINKKIFAIKEQAREERQKQIEIDRENRTAKRIEEILKRESEEQCQIL